MNKIDYVRCAYFLGSPVKFCGAPNIDAAKTCINFRRDKSTESGECKWISRHRCTYNGMGRKKND